MKDHQELISLYLHGLITDDEFEELRAWMSASPANARVFARETLISRQVYDLLLGESQRFLELPDFSDNSSDGGMLPPAVEGSDTTGGHRQNMESTPDSSSTAACVGRERSQVDPVTGQSPSRLTLPPWPRSDQGWAAFWVRRSYRIYAASLLLAFMISIIILSLSRNGGSSLSSTPSQVLDGHRSTSVAVITGLYGIDSTATLSQRQSFSPGDKLALSSGFVELMTRDRVIAVIEAPAEVEFIDAKHLSLNDGQVVARVPRGAAGFTVLTPTGEIVDLGTEFGVSVAAGVTGVTVFEGRVQLLETALSKGTGSQLELGAGWSSGFGTDGRLFGVQRTDRDTQSHFARRLPQPSYMIAALEQKPAYYHQFDWKRPGSNLIGEGEYLCILSSGATISGEGPVRADEPRVNDAVVLARANASINIQGGMTPAVSTQAYTIVFWVRPDLITESNLFSGTNNLGALEAIGPQLSLLDDGTLQHYVLRKGSTASQGYVQRTDKALVAGRWTQVAVSASSYGDMRIYIDGKEAASRVVIQGRISLPHEHLVIGGESRGYDGKNRRLEAFRGAVDEFVFYDRVLNEQAVRGLAFVSEE